MKTYEATEPCLACGVEGPGLVTFHHIKSRGSGGKDTPENMMPLCQLHHNEIHQKGAVHMSIKYPAIDEWLVNQKWRLCNFTRSWRKK